MRIKHKYPKRIRTTSFAIALSIGIALFIASFSPLSDYIENRIYDFFLRSRTDPVVSSEVIIVFIGDDTVATLGSWPLTRDYYATLIHILNEFGAKQIVFDLLFSEEDAKGEFNQALVEETQRAGNVYLPYYMLTGNVRPFPNFNSTEESPAQPEGGEPIATRRIRFPVAFDCIFPFENLKAACQGLGHSNVSLDPDGIIRRHPLFINFNDVLFPSLGMVVASDYLDISSQEVQIISDNFIQLDNAHRIPVDDNGNMLINFNKELTQFENYSMLQLFQSYKQYSNGETPFIAPESFKDKIVLIGMTATGGTDLNPTPVSALYPLVGAQATIISNILTENYLRTAPSWALALEMIVLMLILTCFLVMFRSYFNLLLSILLLITVGVGHFVVITSTGLYINTLLPLIAIVLAFSVINVYLFRLERISRERLRNRLSVIIEQLRKKDRQIYQVEAALSKKSEEMDGLIKSMEEEEKISLNDEIDRLRQERDALSDEHHNLVNEKSALSEKLEIMKGVAKKFIFSTSKKPSGYDQLKGDYNQIIGKSGSLLQILQKVDRAARFDSNILITGESGVGKELIARAVHYNSPRKKGALVIVNCAAIPSELIESELFGHEKGSFTSAVSRRIGKFELAHHGTLFLDEIGDMPINMQAKILRAIQQREFRRVGGTKNIHVDIRLVAATNKDLLEEVKNNHFREDLFHRLNVIPIHVPALRDRKEDIPLLVEYSLSKKSTAEKPFTITQGVMAAFLSYPWPGNIRELEQAVERMTVLADGDRLTIDDLSSELIESATKKSARLWKWGTEISLKRAVEEFERKYLYKKLRQYEWNIPEVSDKLQIERRTLQKKMKKHGIVREKTTADHGD
ncbi:MAG: hypothetical protein B6244_04065 [Candidatus Cloacimonetes bacterium 4572_55]|nr:MAG: hypothetical protein B6244_04065 [Candidatus Cloacimonetes bacterium 4572_55]